jgi:hypothetical protein
MQHLRTAIEHMLNDQGLDVVDAATVELPKMWVDEDGGPSKDAVDWRRVDTFLGTLNAEDLETFCIGDQDDMVAIAKQHGVEGDYAYRALDMLFTGIGA